eukprot:763827-Hanusia_phi.AAC.1
MDASLTNAKTRPLLVSCSRRRVSINSTSVVCPLVLEALGVLQTSNDDDSTIAGLTEFSSPRLPKTQPRAGMVLKPLPITVMATPSSEGPSDGTSADIEGKS